MWDGSQIAAEFDEDFNITNHYLFGRGQRRISGTDITTNKQTYYIYNAHGDVEALADAGGVVTKTYRYDAFGNEENETAGDTNPFRYSGEYYDTETGNIYLRNRYYNPDNARFIQMDSYWNVKNSVYSDVVEGETLFPNISNIRQSGNLYAYCLNNPILYEDITGELAYPGQIHNLVVNMVAKTYELEKEQTIDYKNSVFWGRADLINGKTGEVWDVKPYTDDPKKHAKQEAQVQKYVNNVWKKHEDVDLKVGENNIAPGKFYFDSGYDRYYVEYSFTGKGIISYEYEKVTDWESVKEDAKEAGIVIITAAIITAAVAASGGSASGVAVGVASNAGALATLGGA